MRVAELENLQKVSQMEMHLLRLRRSFFGIRLTSHPKSDHTTNLAFSLFQAPHILERPCTNCSCRWRTSHHVPLLPHYESKHEVL